MPTVPNSGRLQLGCTGLLLLSLAIPLALFGLLAPWCFHIGGQFTPIYWKGVGRLRTADGDQYGVYVYFAPWFNSGRGGAHFTAGRKGLAHNDLRGDGSVCTTQGARYQMRLSGDIYAWLDTDGRETDLDLRETGSRRPRRGLRLYGIWRGPDLVMDDHKFMVMTYLPGGALALRKSYTSPLPEKYARITLTRGTLDDFERLCGDLRAGR